MILHFLLSSVYLISTFTPFSFLICAIDYRVLLIAFKYTIPFYTKISYNFVSSIHPVIPVF